MSTLSGREREASLIRQANRAAAVGRLMLGELDSWQEFLEAETTLLVNLPRRRLKAALLDVRERLSDEIRKFCAKNFRDMDVKKLSALYEEIKSYRGLELPLSEFEKRFAVIRRDILKGNPAHLTVHISLWGLQFKFPEDELAKDLASALQLTSKMQSELNQFKTKKHAELESSRPELSSLTRHKMFAVRSATLCCFNLMEAYLNGIAWDYVQTHNIANLSNTQRKLLEDTTSASTRDKLRKYPEILTGKELWKEPDQEFDEFIDVFKLFRDSLVHPSPFSAPEKFGGYDKLRLFYRIDGDTAISTADLLIRIIKKVHKHVYPNIHVLPQWISELDTEVKEIRQKVL